MFILVYSVIYVDKVSGKRIRRDSIDFILSQEVVWLPAWLQQHDDGEPTDEQRIVGGGGETSLELDRGFLVRITFQIICLVIIVRYS